MEHLNISQQKAIQRRSCTKNDQRSSHIHRRVPATREVNALDLVRLRPKTDFIYDVDTTIGHDRRIVATGLNVIGKYGGLSVQTDINVHTPESPDGFLMIGSNNENTRGNQKHRASGTATNVCPIQLTKHMVYIPMMFQFAAMP